MSAYNIEHVKSYTKKNPDPENSESGHLLNKQLNELN